MRRAFFLALVLAVVGCVLVTGQGTYIHRDISRQSGTNATNAIHKFEIDLR